MDEDGAPETSAAAGPTIKTPVLEDAVDSKEAMEGTTSVAEDEAGAAVASAGKTTTNRNETATPP